MDRATELRAELRQLQEAEREAARREAQRVKREFQTSSKLDIYTASDYAGASNGTHSFYYGYEYEWCPEHGFTGHSAHQDCEVPGIEWAFFVSAGLDVLAQYKRSELWYEPEEVLFYLLAGILRFMGESH